VAIRPNVRWQQLAEEQAAQIAAGSLSRDDAWAFTLWPETLRLNTDAALAAFEADLRALVSPMDAEVLSAVERLVLALNRINEQHLEAGLIGYETGERGELTSYIEQSLAESGIDVPAFQARNGIGDAGIAGPWREW
jgi:hypothetical protein